ncbi:MAG: fibronectin type III domain-containing protein, partial [Terriglobales bacterium]
PGGALMPPCPQLIAVSGHQLPLARITASTPLLTLALAAEDGNGDWAAWSNPVVVATTPVAPPPTLSHVQLVPQGVRLRWQLPHPAPQAIAVYRQHEAAPATTPAQPIAHISGTQTSFLDTTITWNQNYIYWLRSTAGSGRTAVESADSRHLAIRTTDVFPPPVPTALQAVRTPSGTGVDLSWNAVSAPDFAGYNVYRRLPGAAWQKRNAAPLPTPVFHDELPPRATGVAYAVTSIDADGNESPRSHVVIVPSRQN